MKKLIVIKSNGNHSNRLLQNLHFEVFCMEHQIVYCNPTFADMAGYYVAPCNAHNNFIFKLYALNLLGGLFHHSRVVKKVFSVVWILSKLGFLKFVRFDKENEKKDCAKILLQVFEKNDTVYVAGWWFRQTKLIEKYKNEMRKRYVLKPSFTATNLLVDKVNGLKESGYILVGIHIRRGDYKKWKEGKYFFGNDTYEEYVENLSEKLLQQRKEKTVCVLFSNETIDIQVKTNSIVSKESWYIDQYIMSLCDYLLGPPSTFTLWASYIGGGKLFHIIDKSGVLIEC